MNSRAALIRRGAVRGALIGIAIALAILALFFLALPRAEAALKGVSDLDPAAAAGVGPGMLASLASIPFGYVLLYLGAIPVVEAVGIAESVMRNMIVILSFGVVGNWTVLGAVYGFLEHRRQAAIVPPAA